MRNGHLFIISGPSGAGKDTIIKGILQKFPDFQVIKSYTTRPTRKSDEVGNRYFVSISGFQKMIREKQLIEYKKYCGNYYGRKKEDVISPLSKGKNIMMEVEVKGTSDYKKIFSTAMTSIFIKYESPERFIERIKRTRPETSKEEIETRKKSMNSELKYEKYYDFSVINPEGHPEKAIKTVAKIIQGVIR